MSETIRLTGALSPREKGYREGFRDGCEKGRQEAIDNMWNDAEKLPKVDKHGVSEVVLVSFENSTLPAMAMYISDGDGGAYYPVGDGNSFVKLGLFVNGWMPLPNPYRPEV